LHHYVDGSGRPITRYEGRPDVAMRLVIPMDTPEVHPTDQRSQPEGQNQN
jgi:hypothetical protein